MNHSMLEKMSWTFYTVTEHQLIYCYWLSAYLLLYRL